MQTVPCRDLDGNITQVPVEELTFRPSIYGVLVRDDEVLLAGYKDGWDYPGGGIKRGETLEVALKREFKEETGLDVALGKIIHAVSDFFTHPTDGSNQTILLFYTVSYISGQISTEYFDDNEKVNGSEAAWHPIESLATLEFFNPLTPEENKRLAEIARAI